MGLLKVSKWCFGFDSELNIRQQIFIWFAGMIRGAIAFGLVLRIDKTFKNRDVIVTTSLSLVVFTTVFFGSFLGPLSDFLFPEQKIAIEEEDEDLQILTQ